MKFKNTGTGTCTGTGIIKLPKLSQLNNFFKVKFPFSFSWTYFTLL